MGTPFECSYNHMGPSQGCPRGIQERILGPLQASRGPREWLLEPSGVGLWRSWGTLGGVLGALGGSWVIWGPSWAVDSFWGRLVWLLGAVMSGSWSFLGADSGGLGGVFGPLGDVLGALG